ncbi:metalloregulator ArsR/SmtB family transcription factor [Tepidiforma sp.]|uniref:ArsR/SmtB family transcription factor n=1 Tax=Tepidiforma sp. TaxID=2682230 RepID=UPI002ADDFAA7|nr:metalloregulator ArsR/SmtB family transcription factor [Tepidiforma sp.]
MSNVPDAVLDEVAERFRLLGDGTRLRMLRVLGQRGEVAVGELAEAVGCSQANVSKHLRLLAAARMVRRRAEGTMAYYRLADPSVGELCALACRGIRWWDAAEARRAGHGRTERGGTGR